MTLDRAFGAREHAGGRTHQDPGHYRPCRVLVEVSDEPARLRLRIHEASPGGGRGLELVRALASRWGVRESSAGRTIWFEVDLTGR